MVKTRRFAKSIDDLQLVDGFIDGFQALVDDLVDDLHLLDDFRRRFSSMFFLTKTTRVIASQI